MHRSSAGWSGRHHRPESLTARLPAARAKPRIGTKHPAVEALGRELHGDFLTPGMGREHRGAQTGDHKYPCHVFPIRRVGVTNSAPEVRKVPGIRDSGDRLTSGREDCHQLEKRRRGGPKRTLFLTFRQILLGDESGLWPCRRWSSRGRAGQETDSRNRHWILREGFTVKQQINRFGRPVDFPVREQRPHAPRRLGRWSVVIAGSEHLDAVRHAASVFESGGLARKNRTGRNGSLWGSKHLDGPNEDAKGTPTKSSDSYARATAIWP